MIHNQKSMIVFGAGGHAKVVIDNIERQGKYKIINLLDDNSLLQGKEVYGYRVIDKISNVEDQSCDRYIVAIGDNKVRQKIRETMKRTAFGLAEAIIHPSVQIARGVLVGNGTVLMAGTVVNSDSVIAENTIINTSATIDHDCSIEEGVHIAPSATLCGGVSVGKYSLIGAGAVIHPGVKIGKNTIVGAGSTVLTDVPDNVTVFGTPAEIKK